VSRVPCPSPPSRAPGSTPTYRPNIQYPISNFQDTQNALEGFLLLESPIPDPLSRLSVQATYLGTWVPSYGRHPQSHVLVIPILLLPSLLGRCHFRFQPPWQLRCRLRARIAKFYRQRKRRKGCKGYTRETAPLRVLAALGLSPQLWRAVSEVPEGGNANHGFGALLGFRGESCHLFLPRCPGYWVLGWPLANVYLFFFFFLNGSALSSPRNRVKGMGNVIATARVCGRLRIHSICSYWVYKFKVTLRVSRPR